MPIPRNATITARIPSDMKCQLEQIACHFDLTISDVLVNCLRSSLANVKRSSLPSVTESIVYIGEKKKFENKSNLFLQ